MERSDHLENLAKGIVGPLHARHVASRRINRLATCLQELLPESQHLTALDIGCGTGAIGKLIEEKRGNIEFTGVDVLVRKDAVIPVMIFDGKKLPFADKSFDFALLIDVLHHTDNQLELLQEAARVSRHFVLLKDHFCQSAWDRLCLRFMDWVGNRAYDIDLPYNYLSEASWQGLFGQCRLESDRLVRSLNLYAWPSSLIFERNLHFISRLSPASKQ